MASVLSPPVTPEPHPAHPAQGIKSIQRIAAHQGHTNGAASVDYGIAAVDTAKAFANGGGSYTRSDGGPSPCATAPRLIGPTTVRFEVPGAIISDGRGYPFQAEIVEWH